METKTEHYLPPGEPAQWNQDEYCCDYCPNPECQREKKFHWNVEKEIGRCFVCGYWINNWYKLKEAYKDVDFSTVLFAERKPIVHTTCSSNFLINAWDHKKSREFLSNRRVGELICRENKILYHPQENKLYVNLKPISPDLPDVFLSRRIQTESKWYVKKATKGIYYAWGWEKFANSKKNVLLCEGIFDLLSTGLYKKGMALLRSDLNDIWFMWLRKHVNKVTLWFDADKAGDKAVKQISEKCLFHQIPFSVVKTKNDPKSYDRNIPSSKKLLEKIEDLIDHDTLPNYRNYIIR